MTTDPFRRMKVTIVVSTISILAICLAGAMGPVARWALFGVWTIGVAWLGMMAFKGYEEKRMPGGDQSTNEKEGS